ncbi:MAG: histidine phosphatase family protein [Myxococcota bacterium]|nr:histidine phosphatase family protein [Myxococcota bacterium]
MNPALPVVYLVRHAGTAWTLTAQHTGRTDLPLTEQGERQARELGASLAALRVDRMLSSPLQRARRTAELAMPLARVEADDDLMEWDYGAYEGRRTAEIEVERPGWRLFRDGCPGGETLESVGTRADRVLGRIRAAGGTVLLVGHREVLRILAVRWIGLAPIEGRRLLLATASLSVLGYDHDVTEPVIHAWNGRIAAATSAR